MVLHGLSLRLHRKVLQRGHPSISEVQKAKVNSNVIREELDKFHKPIVDLIQDQLTSMASTTRIPITNPIRYIEGTSSILIPIESPENSSKWRSSMRIGAFKEVLWCLR